MKFSVFRTQRWHVGNTPDSGLNPESLCAEIELQTLEDLISFCRKVYCQVIITAHDDPEMPELEIYNGYRE